MGNIIKEIRNTIAGHQILIFDDESSYTLTRGEHEVLKLKVGDEYPPSTLQEADQKLTDDNQASAEKAEELSKPAQEQPELLATEAVAPQPEEESADKP